MLTRQISFESVFFYQLPGTKNRSFRQMLAFRGEGLLYPAQYSDQSQIWYSSEDRSSTLMYQISSRFVYSVAPQKPHILPFLGFGVLCCRRLAAYGKSWTWVHNYKPSPIQRYQNCFYSPTASRRNREHKFRCSVHKRDGQTDKQTNSIFFADRAQPNSAW